MQSGDVKLNHLEALVAECWINAEKETAAQIAEEHDRPADEPVTFLFEGKRRKAVANASGSGRIASAFLSDVRSSISTLDPNSTPRFSGLIARVNFHNRHNEGHKSGADLGVVLSKPRLNIDAFFSRTDTIPDQAIGLLAQAKLGRCGERPGSVYRWNPHTDQQVRLFPIRHNYSCLLLYRLCGERQNELRPFGWQLCKNYTADDAQGWLKRDSFPSEKSSAEIMRGLFARSIGTEDAATIKTIIDPSSSAAQAIEVRISWPSGEGPGSSTYLQMPSGPEEQQLSD
jgi:hypothetical protein